jgi:hypothetical protein
MRPEVFGAGTAGSHTDMYRAGGVHKEGGQEGGRQVSFYRLWRFRDSHFKVGGDDKQTVAMLPQYLESGCRDRKEQMWRN